MSPQSVSFKPLETEIEIKFSKKKNFLSFWSWKNLDPDPDPYWPKMLDPDPYWDQYGSKTLRNLSLTYEEKKKNRFGQDRNLYALFTKIPVFWIRIELTTDPDPAFWVNTDPDSDPGFFVTKMKQKYFSKN